MPRVSLDQIEDLEPATLKRMAERFEQLATFCGICAQVNDAEARGLDRTVRERSRARDDFRTKAFADATDVSW